MIIKFNDSLNKLVFTKGDTNIEIILEKHRLSATDEPVRNEYIKKLNIEEMMILVKFLIETLNTDTLNRINKEIDCG